jgi:hypothetical protein
MRQFFADDDVAQHARARANDHVVCERGMPLAGLFARAAQGHALVERHIVADDRSLADHHAHAVIDEEAAADFAPGWISIPVSRRATATAHRAARKRQPWIHSQWFTR